MQELSKNIVLFRVLKLCYDPKKKEWPCPSITFLCLNVDIFNIYITPPHFQETSLKVRFLKVRVIPPTGGAIKEKPSRLLSPPFSPTFIYPPPASKKPAASKNKLSPLHPPPASAPLRERLACIMRFRLHHFSSPRRDAVVGFPSIGPESEGKP